MPISDSKKVATAINRLGASILKAREARDEMNALMVLFTAANPDVTGTPLQGNKAAVASAVTSFDAEVSKAIWDAVIAAIVPSHRGEAL